MHQIVFKLLAARTIGVEPSAHQSQLLRVELSLAPFYNIAAECHFSTGTGTTAFGATGISLPVMQARLCVTAPVARSAGLPPVQSQEHYHSKWCGPKITNCTASILADIFLSSSWTFLLLRIPLLASGLMLETHRVHVLATHERFCTCWSCICNQTQGPGPQNRETCQQIQRQLGY